MFYNIIYCFWKLLLQKILNKSKPYVKKTHTFIRYTSMAPVSIHVAFTYFYTFLRFTVYFIIYE